MGYVVGMSSHAAGQDDLDPDAVRVRVPAKVNLALRVGPRGADGYHPLRTVFQALSLFDEMVVTDAREGVIDLVVAGEDADLVPTDGTDLAVRAALLLRERYGRPDLGAHIHLVKSIPVAAGLAGGSADAAGALLACSVLWDLDTDPAALSALGGELGADVPFALLGGTALGSGRGTELMPLLTRGRYHWALAFAHIGLSTPQVFTHFDRSGPSQLPALPDGLLQALASGDVAQVGRSLMNDLQRPALEMRGELGQTLRFGAGLDGVLGAVLSGSGPTCAFLCTDARAAKVAVDRLGQLPTVRAAVAAIGAAPGAQLLG